MHLKDKYILANCCKPTGEDKIIGYYSFDNVLKVHKTDCPALLKVDPLRLVPLDWITILAPEDFEPEADYDNLTPLDFRILKHHLEWGVDYSLMVASMLHMDRQIVFDTHQKLREMGLLSRVKPLMMQYRKGIAKNKWIKHRNHTYYELTEKGRNYLNYYLKTESG